MSSFEEVFDLLFFDRLQNLYTAIPCIVVNVNDNLEKQSVDVKPAINKKFKNGTVQEQPTIFDVPVVFPASSTSMFSFPIAVGDTVLCVFSQRGLDVFKNSGMVPVTPLDHRKLDRRDAIAIPGLFSFPKARNSPSHRSLPHSTEDAVVVHNMGTANECEMRLKADGSISITTSKEITVNAQQAVVNADNVDVYAATSSFYGDVTITGTATIEVDAVIGGISFINHVHPINSGSSAPGPTGAPQ